MASRLEVGRGSVDSISRGGSFLPRDVPHMRVPCPITSLFSFHVIPFQFISFIYLKFFRNFSLETMSINITLTSNGFLSTTRYTQEERNYRLFVSLRLWRIFTGREVKERFPTVSFRKINKPKRKKYRIEYADTPNSLLLLPPLAILVQITTSYRG